MLEIIANLPDRVLGVRASGWVGADDYATVLTPAVEAAIARHGKLRVPYRIGAYFHGFTPGATWDDMRLGWSHLHAWERVAVVTDNAWIAGTLRLLLFALPVPAKLFALAESALARDWLLSD